MKVALNTITLTPIFIRFLYILGCQERWIHKESL